MNARAHADFDISDEMAENVTPIKPLTHEEKLERLADIHREKAHGANQIMADIRQRMKAEAASFKAKERAVAASYKAEMASIAEEAANSKARDELLLAGEKRLASYNQKAERAALDALAE